MIGYRIAQPCPIESRSTRPFAMVMMSDLTRPTVVVVDANTLTTVRVSSRQVGGPAVSREDAEIVVEPQRVEARIRMLKQMTSGSNWDTEGACAIAAEEWERAAKLVKMAPTFIPFPFISPCGDGAVHVRWILDGKQFTIETREPEFHWMFRNRDGKRSYGEANGFQHAIELLIDHLV